MITTQATRTTQRPGAERLKRGILVRFVDGNNKERKYCVTLGGIGDSTYHYAVKKTTAGPLDPAHILTEGSTGVITCDCTASEFGKCPHKKLIAMAWELAAHCEAVQAPSVVRLRAELEMQAKAEELEHFTAPAQPTRSAFVHELTDLQRESLESFDPFDDTPAPTTVHRTAFVPADDPRIEDSEPEQLHPRNWEVNQQREAYGPIHWATAV